MSSYVISQLRAYERFSQWWAWVPDHHKSDIISEIEIEINGAIVGAPQTDANLGKVWLVVLKKGKSYHPRQDLEVKTS
ncbi:hypothetical protein ACI394_29765, partial [Klebsiella pneumoniae]|uniref:hypothetical protein n=1 Tax=Klebsiella pneumoniae TaxID=573 RepID=UPI003852A386